MHCPAGALLAVLMTRCLAIGAVRMHAHMLSMLDFKPSWMHDAHNWIVPQALAMNL
jgi:hypothetical protein